MSVIMFHVDKDYKSFKNFCSLMKEYNRLSRQKKYVGFAAKFAGPAFITSPHFWFSSYNKTYRQGVELSLP